MPPGPQFPDYVRDRLVTAVCDEGLGPKAAQRRAAAGELQGFDPSWPVPSFTTVRDWVKLERRARAERQIMDRDKPVGDVIDSMSRRVLALCERDLERLENQPAGKVDYAAMTRMMEAVRKVAQSIGAEPKRPRSDKLPKDEHVGNSAVLEAVQKVAAASRAESAQPTQGKTETSQPTHNGHMHEQQDGRSHLLHEAEAMAQRRIVAGQGANGVSSP